MSGIRFSSREKKILFVFIFVCGVFLVYSGFYRPVLAKRRQIAEDTARERKQLAEQTRVIRKARALEERFKGDLALFRQTTSDEQVMTEVLSEIEAAVVGLDVRIMEMKPLQAQKEDRHNKFTVSLTVEGDFRKILEFIHVVQGPEHNLVIGELRMEHSERTPGALIVRLAVSRILIP